MHALISWPFSFPLYLNVLILVACSRPPSLSICCVHCILSVIVSGVDERKGNNRNIIYSRVIVQTRGQTHVGPIARLQPLNWSVLSGGIWWY